MCRIQLQLQLQLQLHNAQLLRDPVLRLPGLRAARERLLARPKMQIRTKTQAAETRRGGLRKDAIVVNADATQAASPSTPASRCYPRGT